MSQDPVEDVKGATGAGALAVPALMALVLLFVVVLAALFTALSALFAAPLLIALTRLLDRRDAMTFGRAFGGCWLGTFCCLMVIGVLLWALPDRITAPIAPALQELQAMLEVSHRGPAPTPISAEAWRAAAIVAVPGLAAFALALMSHTGGTYGGAPGFIRALAVSVPVLGISCPVAFALLVTAVERFHSRQIAATDAFSTGFYFAVLTFVGATGAAVAGALALGPWSRWVFRWRGLRWSEVIGPVYLGMALYLFITEAVVFLLPDHHPLLIQARLLAATNRVDEWAAALARVDGALLLRELAWVQLPGLVVFASVISSRIGGVYAGWRGWPRAGVAVLAMLAFTTLAFWGGWRAADTLRQGVDPSGRQACATCRAPFAWEAMRSWV